FSGGFCFACLQVTWRHGRGVGEGGRRERCQGHVEPVRSICHAAGLCEPCYWTPLDNQCCFRSSRRQIGCWRHGIRIEKILKDASTRGAKAGFVVTRPAAALAGCGVRYTFFGCSRLGRSRSGMLAAAAFTVLRGRERIHCTFGAAQDVLLAPPNESPFGIWQGPCQYRGPQFWATSGGFGHVHRT